MHVLHVGHATDSDLLPWRESQDCGSCDVDRMNGTPYSSFPLKLRVCHLMNTFAVEMSNSQ